MPAEKKKKILLISFIFGVKGTKALTIPFVREVFFCFFL